MAAGDQFYNYPVFYNLTTASAYPNVFISGNGQQMFVQPKATVVDAHGKEVSIDDPKTETIEWFGRTFRRDLLYATYREVATERRVAAPGERAMELPTHGG